MPKYEIYVDGGIVEQHSAGAGAAVLYIDGQLHSAAIVTAPQLSNNQAELLGAIIAFERIVPYYMARRCSDCGVLGFKGVCTNDVICNIGEDKVKACPWPEFTIWSDSQYVVKGLTQWVSTWQAKGWKTADGKPVLNQPYWEGLLARSKIGNWTMKHTPGHAGKMGNEMADALCALGKALQAEHLNAGNASWGVYDLDAATVVDLIHGVPHKKAFALVKDYFVLTSWHRVRTNRKLWSLG